MDPRHPEKALPRIKELIEQYERVEKDIASATVPNKIGEFEREGFMVIQEMSFITPRLHERLALITRQRRRDLGRGKVYEPVEKSEPTEDKAVEDAPEAEEPEKEETDEPTEEAPEEKPAEEDSATGSKTEQVEPVKEEKPKQTAKKKTTKKANK